MLIGSIFSPAEPEKGNTDILKDIFVSTCNMEGLFSWIKRYAGSYALLYKDDKKTVILHDALALREIYYCSKENQIICGSQPNLLIKFAKPKILPRSDPDFLEYYTTHSKNSKWNPYCKWIGDETYYEGIKHLLPNHYLDINRCEARRYWPNEPIKQLDLEEAVSKSCSFLQGSIRAVANRHSVMMAVTAGTDSRTLLAATRDIQDKIYYFINSQGLGPSHPDISVPKKIFESIRVPFHIHDVPNDVDDEFRQIFLSNTFFASERILPTIYNIYFKDHSEKVNILGIGEIGRIRFGKEPKNLNSYRIAYKMGYKEGRYAITQGESIVAELLPVGREYGLNVLTLLYWEHWLGNWGATGNSESDIAIEEIDPYDSHKLYEIFLGVDDRYTNYYKPVIFREMIRKMWPELTRWPINPPYKLQDKVAKCLKEIGIYSLLKEMKYRVNYVRHRTEARL
ncbi:MAG: hypothetical protein WCC06_13155 [Candidatus Aminicenantales bacterium]